MVPPALYPWLFHSTHQEIQDLTSARWLTRRDGLELYAQSS
jgi:hypothetical protein